MTDLDREVAERLLGIRDYDAEPSTLQARASQSWDGAQQVVNLMSSRGYTVLIYTREDPPLKKGAWAAMFETDRDQGFGEGATLPEAICRAALDAEGVSDAREDVPALIAEVRRLRGKCDKLKGLLSVMLSEIEGGYFTDRAGWGPRIRAALKEGE